MFRGGLVLLAFSDIFMYILRKLQEEVLHLCLIKNPSEPYSEEDESSFQIHSFIVYAYTGRSLALIMFLHPPPPPKKKRMRSSYKIET